MLARQPPVDVLEHLVERDHAGELRRRVREARRAAEVALLGDLFQQNAGVLRLHLAEPVQVGGGDRIVVPECVRRVHLGRRGPFLEVAEDLGDFIVQRDHLPVPGAAAHQPDLAVLLGQVAAEPRHEAERPIGMLAVTRGAERYDVAQDAEVFHRHPTASDAFSAPQ